MKHSNTETDREYGSHMMSIPGIHLKKYNKHWNKQVSRICLQALLQKKKKPGNYQIKTQPKGYCHKKYVFSNTASKSETQAIIET